MLVVPPVLGAQSVRGAVLEVGSNKPVADVSVSLINTRDSVVAGVRTDEAGRFFLTSPRPGTYFITVRKIGFVGGTSPELSLLLADTYEITLRLSRITELATQMTIVDPKRPWLSAFADRRANWFGSFLTAVDIRKLNLTATADVLRTLTGVVIRTNAQGHPSAWSSYGDKRGSRGPCELLVVTDDRIDDDGLTITFVRPNNIEAIELYAGAPRVPPKYALHEMANCGVLVIWTREGSARRARP